jgi:hypothetical protein
MGCMHSCHYFVITNDNYDLANEYHEYVSLVYRRSDKVLNDSMVFCGILDQIKPELGVEFMKLKEIRNKSPLTHGKIFDDECLDVTLDDLKKLSRFFKKLLDINSDT